jgi:4-hydroxy-tetrahydrodipicolinate reductase
MTSPVTFASYGLGPIGQGIAKLALDRGHRMVAAIDVDPEKVGRDTGTLLGAGPNGVSITADPAVALARKPDVVLHCTSSRLPQVTPQILGCVEAGARVISTCEELSFPWRDHADEARRIDAAAKARSVTVVGVGVNPGFVMDLLPLVITGLCREVRGIKVTRVVDASKRRLPLQRKVGAGMTREEFDAGVKTGKIGHVGLAESIAMTAGALGWNVDDISETIEPVLKGSEVKGLHQVAVGSGGGRALITLDLTMEVGASTPHDTIVIDGDPPLTVTAAGGVHGDVATWAVAVNAIGRVMTAAPGLATVSDLPPFHP